MGPSWALSCCSVDFLFFPIPLLLLFCVDTQRFFSYYPIYKITHTQVSARARHNVYNKPNYKIIADFSITYTARRIYLVVLVWFELFGALFEWITNEREEEKNMIEWKWNYHHRNDHHNLFVNTSSRSWKCGYSNQIAIRRNYENMKDYTCI